MRPQELVERRTAATKKRASGKENFDKVQKRNPNSYQSQKAQSLLSEAENEEAKANKEMYAGIEAFERQKVRDIKVLVNKFTFTLKVLCTEYIHSEIAYHAQCLEAMTGAFGFFETVSEDKEIKVLFLLLQVIFPALATAHATNHCFAATGVS